MGAGAGAELARTVARGDVGRREPESQGGPEPSDRSRDRQEKCKGKKTEEKESAAAAGRSSTEPCAGRCLR